MALPPLILRVIADTRQAQASMAAVQRSSVGMATGVKVGAAIAGIALLKFAADSVKAASDSIEAQNKANETFGTSIDTINEFAATSAKIGIATSEAHDMTAAFGQMFKTAGFAEQSAADMSVRMVQLAADMASFNNQDPSEMLQRLQSGLAGQARPLRQFGVFLSDSAVKAEAARLGIAALGTELTDAQKIQARYSLILKQSTDQHGDFARTVGESLPNQIRQLRAEYENVKSEVGVGLIPVMTSLIGVVQSLMPVLKALGLAFEVVGKSIKFMVAPLRSIEDEFGVASDAAGLFRVAQQRLTEALADGTLTADQVSQILPKVNALMADMGGEAQLTAKDIVGLGDSAQTAAMASQQFAEGVATAGDEARKSREEIEKLSAAQRSLSGGAVGLIQSFSNLTDAQAKVNELSKAGKKGSQEYRSALAAQVQAQIDLTSKVSEWQSAMNTAGASQRDVIEDVRQFAKDAGLSKDQTDLLVSSIKKIPSKASTQFTTPGLPDAISSTEHWARLIAGLPRHVSIAMQFRALNQPPPIPRQHGGPVWPGQPFLVGERGPEVFVPSQSGTIEPGVGPGTIVLQLDRKVLATVHRDEWEKAIRRGRTL